MAQIILELPDDQMPLVGEAFADEFSEAYSGEDDDSEAKVDFAREKIMDFIHIRVREYQIRKAQADAAAAVPEQVLNIS